MMFEKKLVVSNICAPDFKEISINQKKGKILIKEKTINKI